MDNLNDVLRDTSASQGKGKPFGCQRCLRRRFDQNCIACNDGREYRIDGDKEGEAATCEIRDLMSICGRTYFQGAITRTIPSGVRLIYRLNPGLSVLVRGTSAREDSAMDNI